MDFGVVEVSETGKRKCCEIDFVITPGKIDTIFNQHKMFSERKNGTYAVIFLENIMRGANLTYSYNLRLDLMR